MPFVLKNLSDIPSGCEKLARASEGYCFKKALLLRS
jgi:hypothetical protein